MKEFKENIKSYLKKESEEKLTEIKEIKHKLENDNLNKKEKENLIITLFNQINFYYGSDNKIEGRKLAEYGLKYYDNFVDEEHKLDILLLIPEKTLFHNYALKYYSLFQEQLKKIVFFNLDYESELNDISDFQLFLDFKFKLENYRARIIYLFQMRETLGEFYKLFKNVLTFKIRNNFEKWDNMFFLFMDYEELVSILIDEMNKKTEYINEILKVLFEKHYNKLRNSNYYEYFFKNRVTTNQILNYVSSLIKKDSSIQFCNNLEKYILEVSNNLEDLPNIEVSKMFSTLFLENLNFLRREKRKDLKNNFIYLKCFQIFLNEMLSRFEERVELKDIFVIESLFQRIIQESKITEIVKINDKKSLYHYFKTNEYISEIPLSLEQIKEYKAKQYLKLIQIYEKDLAGDNLFLVIDIIKEKSKMQILELLIYLSYDFLLESNLLENDSYPCLLEKIRGKDQKYIEKLKKVLKEDYSILKNEEDILSLFLYIFDYFYKINYSKITSTKIKQYIDSGSYMLFPNNIHLEQYLKKLTFVHKGNPLLEKIEAIKLYQDYRFRILSSIPDTTGKIDEIYYKMVDLHDPNIISNGIGEYSFPNNQFASSCLTPNGKAKSCLFHGAINPNGRFFKVTYQDKIIAYSWVWRCGDILCFDNIEVTKDLYNIAQYEEIISQIYLEVSKKLINITNKQENRGIQLVILGKNRIDVLISPLLKLPQVNQYTKQLYHPNSFENLYLKDSSEIQIILAGNYSKNLITEDIEPQYLYSRKPIYKFSNIKKDILLQKINAIYFDYCIDKNITYHKILEDTYIDGFGNEDWFIGLKKDKTKDFFYCGKDQRLFQEAEKYDQILVNKNSFIKDKIIFSRSKLDQIKFLLDYKNYILELKEVQEYLKEETLEKFILSNQDYSHKTKDLLTFSKILLEGKITSAEYGDRKENRGFNGKNYISVAKIGSPVYKEMLGSKTFILSDDMCTFSAFHEFELREHSHFTDTTYPLRPNAHKGEYQVLNFISLDKAKGILVSKEIPIEIAQIIYLQELLENQLPLILLENNQIIDKENIKKYIKLK